MLQTNHEALLAEVDSLKGDILDLGAKVTRLETQREEAREELVANRKSAMPVPPEWVGIINQAAFDGWARGRAMEICPSLFEKNP